MKDSHAVYLISCSANNSVYIGSSITVRKRLMAHRSGLKAGTHDNIALQRTWDKYGEGSFKFEVIEHVHNKFHLRSIEGAFISYYMNTSKTVLNIELDPCHPGLGVPMAYETKMKIQKALKGKPKSDEHSMKVSEALKGKTISEETRAKIAEKLKGRKLSEETKSKMSASRMGHKVNDDTRAKIGAKHKGKTISAETIEKAKKTRGHYVISDETRTKMKEAGLARRGIPRSPETVEKMRTAAFKREAARREANAASKSQDDCSPGSTTDDRQPGNEQV